MSLSGAPQIYVGDPYQEFSDTTIGHQPGARGVDKYGDLYRWAIAGASNISAGKLQVCPAPKTNHHNIAATAAVTADGIVRKVTLQLGATAATANEYAGGILSSNDNSPEGESYRIVNHPAADSAATLEITVDRPFKTSIATTSEFELLHNNWNGVVEATVEERAPAGVPLVDITAAYGCFLKTRGIASVLIGTAAGLGGRLVSDASTGGAVTDANDTYGTSNLHYTIGKAKVAGTSGEYNAVELMID